MKIKALILLALLCMASTAQADMGSFSRTVITGDVVHYQADVPVGPGEHDKIRLHRVVREAYPYIPAPTEDGIFAVHGDTTGFASSWLIGPDDGSAESSVAVWFAERDIDFWAIELRDRLVTLPPESDFSFMADWGFDTNVSDIRYGMQIARIFRFGKKMHLLGWSRGGQLSYVVAGLESQVSPSQRNAKSLIIWDVPLKFDDPVLTANACVLADQVEAAIASGIYVDPLGSQLSFAGTLAATVPTDPSPLLPGFTNYQAILFVGGATWALSPTPFTPTYHLVGANFDEFGVPTGLLFTEPDAFIETTIALPPYSSLAAQLDGNRVACEDTVHDDHIGDIDIPVFNLAAAGGFGYTTVHTTTLLTSSPDVQSTVIQLLPSEAVLADFGHDDLARSTLADDLVWEPMRVWTQTH